MINEDFVDKVVRDLKKDYDDGDKASKNREALINTTYNKLNKEIGSELDKSKNNTNSAKEKNSRLKTIQKKIKKVDNDKILQSIGYKNFADGVVDGFRKFNFTNDSNGMDYAKNNWGLDNKIFQKLYEDSFKIMFYTKNDTDIKLDNSNKHIEKGSFIVIYKTSKEQDKKNVIAIDLEDAYFKKFGGGSNFGSTDSVKDVVVNGKDVSLKTTIDMNGNPIPHDISSKDAENNMRNSEKKYVFDIVGYNYETLKNVKYINDKELKNKAANNFITIFHSKQENIKKDVSAKSDKYEKINFKNYEMFYKSIKDGSFGKTLYNELFSTIRNSYNDLKIKPVSAQTYKSIEARLKKTDEIFNYFSRNSTEASNIYNNIKKFKKYVFSGLYFYNYDEKGNVINNFLLTNENSRVATKLRNRLSAVIDKYFIDKKLISSDFIFNNDKEAAEEIRKLSAAKEEEKRVKEEDPNTTSLNSASNNGHTEETNLLLNNALIIGINKSGKISKVTYYPYDANGNRIINKQDEEKNAEVLKNAIYKAKGCTDIIKINGKYCYNNSTKTPVKVIKNYGAETTTDYSVETKYFNY